MELNTGKYGATRQSWSRASIRTIYAEIKATKPKANHTILVKLLAERMREDDDALLAAADYVVINCPNLSPHDAPMTPNPPPSTTWNKAAVKAAVDWVAQNWIPQIEDQIDSQMGVEWFAGVCAKWLRNGERLDIMKVIKAAERDGDFIAHRSLMKAFHDMLDADEMPPASLRAYASRADERLAPHRGRGSHIQLMTR